MEDIYFNEKLAQEFKSDYSIPLTFLKHDLTGPDFKKRMGTGIAARIGVNFENLGISETTKLEQIVFQRIEKDTHETKKLRQIPKEEPWVRDFSSLKIGEKISLDKYLDIGEDVLIELGFPYHRFSGDNVLSYIVLSEHQKKAFSNAQLYNLSIGNLAEGAMRELLFKNDVDFIARPFLIHNSNKKQKEKGITISTPEKKTMGVRCQREFIGSYLYPLNRLRDEWGEIADYIVFFNHLGHHIFYITGIVEKDFLKKKEYSGGNVQSFYFPEQKPLMINQYLGVKTQTLSKEQTIELNNHLRKRLSYKQFIGMLERR